MSNPGLPQPNFRGDSRRNLQTVNLAVEGMHCAGCVGAVEAALRDATGVERATVDLTSGTARVEGSGLDSDQLARLVSAQGYAARPISPERTLAEQRSELEEKQRRNVRSWRQRALLGLLLWLPLMLLHMPMDLRLVEYSPGFHHALMWFSALLATLAQVLVGWGFYKSAGKAARNFTTNMDTLIALGSTVAWCFSAIVFGSELAGWKTGQPMYWEAAAGLLALVSLGHWLEARSMVSASSALRHLLALQPEQVSRLRTLQDERGELIATADVLPGDLLVFQPGDRIAVDGKVAAGASAVDESVVTGEPLPVEKWAGAMVAAGSLNTTGKLIVSATTSGRETTIARIAEMVQQAQSSKAAIARLADKVCAVFVPAVIGIAGLTFAGWLAHGLATSGNNWSTWAQALVTATSVLVISCPCALGLATPTAIMVGAGAASERGILVKSAAALERTARTEVVLLDKTGTLTVGKPEVNEVLASDRAPQDILGLAASLAAQSRHPLSQAVVRAAREQHLEIAPVTELHEQAGRGLSGLVGGARVELVSLSQALREGLDLPPAWQVADGTQSVVLVNSAPVGSIRFEDQLRPDAAAVISQLKALGLQVLLATGDRNAAGQKVAAGIGITPSQTHCEMTPAGKRQLVQQLSEGGRPVAMIGDGINDAAALAEAGARGGVGIAIGTGTNIAIESADIVIPAQRLAAIPETIELSRATLRTIKQNLFLSFVYNVVAIPAAALGLLGTYGPMYAAAAMALSDVSVIGNALWLKSHLKRNASS
ncbi:MAG: heavy metal translocating P-type ATPase [Planctomycetota bacterium]